MPRPSRIRRILKWTGVVLSLLFLAALTLSLWVEIRVLATHRALLILDSGNAGAMMSNVHLVSVLPPTSLASSCWQRHPIQYAGNQLPYWRFRGPTPPHIVGQHLSWVVVPIWLLLLLTAIPTAWLWHRDRRLLTCSTAHLFCRTCGYDLTGNTSGVCPECGDKACPPAVLADSECRQAKPPPATV